MGTFEIAPAVTADAEVRALVERHLAFAGAHTASEFVFALDSAASAEDPSVTLFCARVDGRVVAVGALREIGMGHGEVKSMHTASGSRRAGAGRAVLDHLVVEATRRGYRRRSLETGSSEDFAPARALHVAAGFEACGAFGDYPGGPQSCFMTRRLGPGRQTTDDRRQRTEDRGGVGSTRIGARDERVEGDE